MNRRSIRRNQKRGKHQKADPAIRRTVQRIEAVPEVRRVLLQRRFGCTHSFRPGTIRYRGEIRGGLRLRGYTDRGVRNITVLVDGDIGRRAVLDIVDETL